MTNSGVYSLPGRCINFTLAKNIIAESWGHTPDEITTRCRRSDVLIPRQLAMYIGHNHFHESLASVGFKMGRFDHATAFNACKQIRNMFETDKFFRAKVIAILPKIGIEENRFIR